MAVINNAYFPLMPGTTYLYHLSSADSPSQDITVTVTHDTKTILGVTCIVVHDTATSNGQLVEDTFDWYAQDKDGNVWYFGEDTKQYENGQVVSTEGSWEAGVNNAKPGIVMEGQPRYLTVLLTPHAPLDTVHGGVKTATISNSRMEHAIAIFTAATARSHRPNDERNRRFSRPTP